MKLQFKYFTIIELAVIILIMSIVFSMLMPALNKSILAAQQISCMTNIKQLSVGHHLYAEDQDDFFPPVFSNWPNLSRKWWTHDDIVTPYIGKNVTEIKCPSSETETNSHYGISIHSWAVKGSWSIWHTTNAPVKRQRLDEPEQRMQGGESTSIVLYTRASMNWIKHGESGFRTSAFRHGLKTNIFYYDGHAEAIPYEDFSDKARELAYFNKDAIIRF